MLKLKGFSLMEIIVALSVIVALGSSAVFATGHLIRMARYNSARSGAASVAVSVNQYRLEMGKYPASLSVLTSKASSGKGPWLTGSYLTDPWEKSYNYAYDEDEQRFAVWSSGPNMADNSGAIDAIISRGGFSGDDIGFLSR